MAWYGHKRGSQRGVVATKLWLERQRLSRGVKLDGRGRERAETLQRPQDLAIAAASGASIDENLGKAGAWKKSAGPIRSKAVELTPGGCGRSIGTFLGGTWPGRPPTHRRRMSGQRRSARSSGNSSVPVDPMAGRLRVYGLSVLPSNSRRRDASVAPAAVPMLVVLRAWDRTVSRRPSTTGVQADRCSGTSRSTQADFA